MERKFFVVVSGKDSDFYNKLHQPKPLLELNSRKNPPTAALFATSDATKCYDALSKKVAEDLITGAFRIKGFNAQGKPELSPDPTKFRRSWIYKEGRTKYEVNIFRGISASQYDVYLVWKALSNVDVFTYTLHGWGDALWVGSHGNFAGAIYTGNAFAIENAKVKYSVDELRDGTCSLYGTNTPPLR